VARGSGRFAKVKLVLDIFVLAGGSRLQGSDVAVFKGGRYVLGSPSRSSYTRSRTPSSQIEQRRG